MCTVARLVVETLTTCLVCGQTAGYATLTLKRNRTGTGVGVSVGNGVAVGVGVMVGVLVGQPVGGHGGEIVIGVNPGGGGGGGGLVCPRAVPATIAIMSTPPVNSESASFLIETPSKQCGRPAATGTAMMCNAATGIL
jgi:hypothetical protein